MHDEREERWLEREWEREAQRETKGQSEAPAHPAPSSSSQKDVKKPNGSTKARKTERRRELAQSLGVTVDDLAAANRAQSEAAAGLSGVADKNEKVARHLSITTGELKVLRKALNGAPVPKTQAASLIRTVASTVRPRRVQPTESSSPKPNEPKPTRRVTGEDPLPVTTLVFVTRWGEVVHLHHDCPNSRGFRRVGESDPDLYKVEARDPSCKGRRVCGTCRNRASVRARRVEYLLKSLHGPFYTESQWRQAFGRPHPQGSRVGGARSRGRKT